MAFGIDGLPLAGVGGTGAIQSANYTVIPAGTVANTTIVASRFFGFYISAVGTNAPVVTDGGVGGNVIGGAAASAPIQNYPFNVQLQNGEWTVAGNAQNPAMTVYWS